jgi:carbon-monoxide dehydrogenase large subunit
VSLFGARVRRQHDPRLLTGRAAYVDDLKVAGALHMAVWRSPLAHALVRGVDLSAVRSCAGVVDAFALSALGDDPPVFPTLITHESLKSCPQYPLARERVRYVGEGVAVVIAEDRALAQDALELVEVDLEPLEPVANTTRATAAAAVRLHTNAENNVCAAWTLDLGDAESAFRNADLVVRETLSMQRYTGVPIEGRGVLAQPDPITDELVIWVSGQWPHTTRTLTARMLGLPEDRIRVITPDVGGGFGVKEEFYPEDLLVAFAARRLNQPVKWIEQRREHMQTVVHAREQTHDIALALRSDGTILGLRDRIVTDMGAYVRALGFVNPSLAAATVPGPYRIENICIQSEAVLTNKSPVSAYRGAGQPEATYARERIFDIAAHRLGMDPAELRQRNLLPPEALPYDTRISSVDGPVRFDSGDFQRALDATLRTLEYQRIRSEQRAPRTDDAEGQRSHSERVIAGAGGHARQSDEPVARESPQTSRKSQTHAAGEGNTRRFVTGVGLAVYAQITGTGPFEGADVRVAADGLVTVTTGAVDIGQGLVTALAQLVGDALGVDAKNVRVVAGDTARIAHGVGTYASRAAVMAGNAASEAAGKVREKATRMAAHMLEVGPADVEWRGDVAGVRGVTGRGVSLAQIAAAMRPGGEARPPDLEPGLEARHYFESDNPPFAYGVHGVVVRLDPETAALSVERYVVVSDAGRLINPMIAEGQITGGVAQGLGGALLEHLAYDEQGQLIASSLLDYALPRARDVPNVEMEHLEIPSPLNPLGIKGLGEGGAVGAHAAVANAVADALWQLGHEVRATPLTPGEIGRTLAE